MTGRLALRISATGELRIVARGGLKKANLVEVQIVTAQGVLQRGHFGHQKAAQIAAFAAQRQPQLRITDSGVQVDAAEALGAQSNVHFRLAGAFDQLRQVHRAGANELRSGRSSILRGQLRIGG